MLKRYYSQFGVLLRLTDALVVAGLWLASYWLRFHANLIEVRYGIPAFETYLALLPLVVVLWDVVLTSFGAYSSSRLPRRTEEVIQLLKAHSVALLLMVTLTAWISEYRYSRATLGIFAVLGAVGLVTSRMALRHLLRALRTSGLGTARALLVGSGPSAELLISRLIRHPELGVAISGRLVSEAGENQAPGPRVPVLGTYSDFSTVLSSQRFDEIWFVLARNESDRLDELLRQVRDETIDLRIIPDLHEYVRLGCMIEDFDGLPIVGVNESPLEGWGSTFKRVTDFVLALIALILFSPVFVAAAIAVRLSSPGPIFYRQQRMGLDGRVFEMLKFRSMPVDAEAKTGPVWATDRDNRKTQVGAILRATSLDELPQLWNVLKGDMSLVGPRPERPFFVDKFRNEIPGYMLRHKVKAGITGWAQIHGWRGDTSLERRIECDLYYIRHWSYWLDWKILWLTIWRGFVHRNAY
jgi:Undecaprenyl-phosphate glucose phosphotransferase